MPDKPLGYDSLKAVLLYMDPNVRLNISRCLPSLKKAEKSVPLKIDELQFGHMKTTINGTTYQVGITRHYPVDAPDPVDNEREFSYDVDKFGFDISFIDLTDGDVDIRYPNNWTMQHNDGGGEDIMRQKVVLMKKRLLEINMELMNLSEVANPLPLKVNYYNNEKVTITSHLNLVSSDLLKYDLRSSNTNPPFTHFIQLTIGDYREQVEYSNKKLFQAMKYLNNFLFGGRKLILVNKLVRWHIGYVIHLPAGFRIKVREVDLRSAKLNELQSILDDSKIHKVTTSEIPDLDHPIIQNSENLVIGGFIMDADNWLPTMMKFENQKTVCWKDKESVFSLDGCIGLVKYWRKNQKPVGTRFFFAMRHEETAKRFMDEARRQFEKVGGGGSGSLTFAMDSTSVLNISYEKIQPEEAYRLPFWFLSLEIQQRYSHHY